MADPQTPDWARDAIFYQIFPDRFARSLSVPKSSHLDVWGAPPTYNGYQGGDLIGVVEHLDYLSDLGVNAIYFTPIFQSASNHRYHTHDYQKVDPMLGGNAALRRLIDESHARNIRVVLDGVFNHASRGFFQFHDILENGPDSAYLDWFTINSFPLNAYDTHEPPNYQAWWNLPALPKFNIACPDVREYLWDVATSWIAFGVDGWRLDVANEIKDDSFWREFRSRVRAVNPEAYIVGEIWNDAQHWLKGDMWDAVMNYHFTRACIAFFCGDAVDGDELRRTSLHPVGATGAESFRRSIERLLGLYHPNVNSVMLNLLSSHDMARYLAIAKNELSALRLATVFQMTYIGAPSIYYGDEIGMSGGHDPANRAAFPWHQPESWNRDLLHDFQRLIALRNGSQALRRGSFQFVYAHGECVCYARKFADEVVIVAINTGTQTERLELSIPDEIAGDSLLHECWSQYTVRIEGGMIRGLKVLPRSSRIFQSERR